MENIISIREVSLQDKSVHVLIQKLDQYQIELYGIKSCNLESAEDLINNKTYLLGAFSDSILVGIGGVKFLDNYAEVKRMYFTKLSRGLGVASKLLESLERYALKKGFNTICLETGIKHYSALSFYKKHGYVVVNNFGDYQPNKVSVYMKKKLTKSN